MERQSNVDPDAWNELAAGLPGAHVLQSWQWGQVKSHFEWQPFHTIWRDESGEVRAAALILERTIPIAGFAARLRVLYVPKGPLLAWRDIDLRRKVLSDLKSLAQQRGAIFIKIDPDVPVGFGVPGAEDAREDQTGQALITDLKERGWRFSSEQIQFRNTVLIDLHPEEEELLAAMKQKTRYNVRLAGRRGVSVRSGGVEDTGLLYKMYAETAVRDGFVIRSERYYQDVWNTFIKAGIAEPLIAEVDGQPVAAVIIFRFAGRAWYLYGMSLDAHREKMPNYLLQWEAIRRTKAAGCHWYDLWGAPDEFVESDPLWGVYRFKEGLAGRVVRHIGAWDLPVRPLLYRLYTQILPRFLAILRRRGRAETERKIGSI